MLPNIILIGFMGCGKSSVGRRIAGNTGRRFVDTDSLVTASEDRSVTRIFAEQGEAYFRDRESAVLGELQGETGMVLATGGGIVLRAENRDALRALGPVVWLDAHPDLLFERVSRNKKRPLLKTENPRATFDALLAARRPIYEAAADVRVDSSGLSHDEAAQQVVEETLRFAPDQTPPGFGS